MNYEFRPLAVGDDDLKAVATLLASVWPSNPRMQFDYIRWLYRENPNGAAIGANAWKDGRLAGHYAIIPFSAERDGQNVKAALSLNTAVGESHRGQGLFKSLAEQTYTWAKSMGVDHIVGVANANSTPGFLKSLRFQLVTSLDVKFLIGRPVKITKPEVLGWRRLWTRQDLQWRLFNPMGHYWCENKGHVIGQSHYPGVRVLLSVLDDRELVVQVRKQLLPGPNTHRPLLWFGTSPILSLPSLKITVPKKFRPSPFNLIFRDLNAPDKKLAAERVHFEAIDFDVV